MEKLNGKKIIVSPLDYNDFIQLCDIRKAIEGEAAFLAAENINKDELEILRKCLVNANVLTKGIQLSIKDEEKFHEIIIIASRNKYIIKAYENYKYNLLRYRSYLIKYNIITYDILRLFLNNHHGIYNALKSRFPSLAKEIMVNDISHMLDILTIKEMNIKSQKSWEITSVK